MTIYINIEDLPNKELANILEKVMLNDMPRMGKGKMVERQEAFLKSLMVDRTS